jgi:hypothetical protein
MESICIKKGKKIKRGGRLRNEKIQKSLKLATQLEIMIFS